VDFSTWIFPRAGQPMGGPPLSGRYESSEGGSRVRGSRDAEYTEYVQSRLPWLRRVAYLLCQDWQSADDLVQSAITRLYTHWGRARDTASIDAYTRTIMVRVFVSERRSAWARRVTLFAEHYDLPAAHYDLPAAQHDHDARLDVRAALAALPPRQRATLVLRFYCDLPVEAAARELGCSAGTVKSQTAKGLEALRRALGPIMAEEA
jgi:RNA polymerase sigma-70 factor (sigma-E family)